MSADPQPNAPGASRSALHPVEWTVQTGAVDDVLAAMDASLARRAARRTRVRMLASASAAVALIVAVFVWQSTRSTSRDDAVGSIVVTRPERTVLPDGSVVELRHGARIATDFSGALRRVRLVEGEAHFQVTKDPARPFVVSAGGVEVRAVGTAFAVEFGATSVEVLVTEGRVAVGASVPVPASAPATPLVYLDAGHNAVVDLAPTPTVPPPQVAALSPADMDTRLAWRVPRLEFSGTPLAEALALIQQHQPVRVEIADPSLGDLRVSGILRADNVANLWRLLEEQHGIRIERRADETVVLSRRR